MRGSGAAVVPVVMSMTTMDPARMPTSHHGLRDFSASAEDEPLRTSSTAE